MWDRHFLPGTLTVDGGYLSPTSNTLLPQSLFHSSQFCHFSSFTIKASTLPFKSCQFDSIHLYFSTSPFCPFQHIRPPHPPDAPPSVSLLPWLLAPRWVGWQERRGGQQEVGRACQSVLPPYRATGTSVRFSYRAECSYTVQGGQRGGGTRRVAGVPVWIKTPLGQTVTHHMDGMDCVAFTVIPTTNRLYKSWFQTPCCVFRPASKHTRTQHIHI